MFYLYVLHRYILWKFNRHCSDEEYMVTIDSISRVTQINASTQQYQEICSHSQCLDDNSSWAGSKSCEWNNFNAIHSWVLCCGDKESPDQRTNFEAVGALRCISDGINLSHTDSEPPQVSMCNHSRYKPAHNNTILCKGENGNSWYCICK